jgi:hypothetical protein
VYGFSALRAEKSTQTIGKYHAAAGKKCDFEMLKAAYVEALQT